MRAAVIRGYGDPDVFIVEDAAPPTVRKRDVLVKVSAAAVNPIDWKIRRGYQRAIICLKFPRVLGLDCSGVITEVDSAVTRFKVGEAVFATPTYRRPGAYAEYVAVDEREVALKPDNITHEQAAGVPVEGLTAMQCFDAGKLQARQKVLIQAGAGGVGTFALQIARAWGVEEIASTCSARNAELASSPAQSSPTPLLRKPSHLRHRHRRWAA